MPSTQQTNVIPLVEIANTTTYLAQQNPHPRDAHIHFEEGPHKYTIQGIEGVTPETEFTSVTTWVHQHFEHFDAKKIIAGMMRNQKKWNDPIANAKYYGKTAEEIEQMWATAGRDAAAAGTAMHYKIECFYNMSPEQQQQQQQQQQSTDTDDATEFKYFLNFNNEYKSTLRPYRTEWTVFHEEARIAGSIDMIYELIQPDVVRVAGGRNPLVIYDWKRCREITKTNRANKFATHPAIEHLPDTNYWHYALQLNVYKYILQSKYGKTITDLYLIVLHPEAQNYQRVKLPDLQSEVAELFQERLDHFAAAAAAAAEGK
jgi:hypothetical protein